jgi:two-component system sensor histidine kinase DegS
VSERQQLVTCVQTLENVTCEIRRIINALRPSMLDNVLGLIPAIENLLDDLRKRSNYKIQAKLIAPPSKVKLSEIQEINLYRIIQEALNNVYKHSNATKVEISVLEQPGQILFLVTDNGIGINQNTSRKGYGLIDMKERAELIGAQVQYLNKPHGEGTTLEIAMPYIKEPEQKKSLTHSLV